MQDDTVGLAPPSMTMHVPAALVTSHACAMRGASSATNESVNHQSVVSQSPIISQSLDISQSSVDVISQSPVSQ